MGKNSINDVIRIEDTGIELNSRVYKFMKHFAQAAAALFTDRTVGFYATDREQFIMKIDPLNRVNLRLPRRALRLRDGAPSGALHHQKADLLRPDGDADGGGRADPPRPQRRR